MNEEMKDENIKIIKRIKDMELDITTTIAIAARQFCLKEHMKMFDALEMIENGVKLAIKGISNE